MVPFSPNCAEVRVSVTCVTLGWNTMLHLDGPERLESFLTVCYVVSVVRKAHASRRPKPSTQRRLIGTTGRWDRTDRTSRQSGRQRARELTHARAWCPRSTCPDVTNMSDQALASCQSKPSTGMRLVVMAGPMRQDCPNRISLHPGRRGTCELTLVRGWCARSRCSEVSSTAGASLHLLI